MQNSLRISLQTILLGNLDFWNNLSQKPWRVCTSRRYAISKGDACGISDKCPYMHVPKKKGIFIGPLMSKREIWLFRAV